MALYVQSDEIKTIARQLKAKYPHTLGDVNLDRIVFLKELESPSKTKLAVTKKVDNALKTVYHASDYIMIFFQKRLEDLLPAQIHVLVLHELMHCEADGDKMRKHDVEEFYEIGAAYGIDWPYNPLCKDPLGEETIELKPKPTTEPDKYAAIMEEDWGNEEEPTNNTDEE